MNKDDTVKLFHDLKNDFAAMSALTNLHRTYAGKIEPSELMDRLHERQLVISVAYEKLYQNGNYPYINIKTFIEELIMRETRTLSACCSNVQIIKDITNTELPLKKALPLAQITIELLTNSHRHAFCGLSGEKKIIISIEAEESRLMLSYSDNGSGLPEGLDPQRAGTLGMQFIKSLSRQLGGTSAFDTGASGLRFSFNFEKKAASQ